MAYIIDISIKYGGGQDLYTGYGYAGRTASTYADVEMSLRCDILEARALMKMMRDSKEIVWKEKKVKSLPKPRNEPALNRSR